MINKVDNMKIPVGTKSINCKSLYPKLHYDFFLRSIISNISATSNSNVGRLPMLLTVVAGI